MREAEVKSMTLKIQKDGSVKMSFELAEGDEVELYEDDKGKLKSRYLPKGYP